nr:uncharacterized protein LOC109780992 [Aegilops tauschii subsp. strangulata]
MVKDLDYPKMAKMDFCEGPVIMYLDSLLLPTNTIEMRKIAKTMDKTSLLRANHLKESDLKKIARADIKRDGKARPDDYEFGKIKGHGKRTPLKHKGQQQHVVKNTEQEDGSNRTSNPTTDDAPSRASTGAVQETNRIGGSKDVLEAQQREEDAHAKQKVDIEELFSTRAFQMSDRGEKASDTAPGDTPKAGIQSKEKVAAQTDIPTTGAKMQETEESTNIQDQQTQQHKGMEQAEDVFPTTDSVTAVDQARKPLLSEKEITGMPMSTQKIEKVKLDCAFYMFMNTKHYTDGGETVYLTEEQVPELRKKILYQIISQYRDTAALSLINYTKDTLNSEVDMKDSKMQRIHCDIIQEEIPPTPEHIGTSAQEIQVIGINDTSSDEEKQDYHVSSKDTTKASEEALTEEQAQTDAGLQREQQAQPDTDLQKEDEWKDPPIEPDRPPPDKKTEQITCSPLEGDNRTKSVLTRQQELSKQNKNPVDEDRKPGISPKVKHAQEEKKQKEKDLTEKILEQRKRDAAVSVEPSIKSNGTQKETPTPRQPNEQAQLGHDKKKARHLARHILGLKDKRKSMKNFRDDFTREKDVLVPLFLKKCQSEKLKTAKMVFMPFEKEDRYTLFMLDRYIRKLEIIEPEETSLEELKRQEYLKNQRDRHVHDGKLIKQIANMENNEAIKEKEHNKYHNHKDKLVPRFKEVYKILLGEKFEKEKTRWDVEFLQGVPKVNKGETPFAVLRFAHLFDGNHFVEEIDNFDDGTEQWKAQQLCKLLFSDQNTIEPSEMGDEIRKIYDDITE